MPALGLATDAVTAPAASGKTEWVSCRGSVHRFADKGSCQGGSGIAGCLHALGVWQSKKARNDWAVNQPLSITVVATFPLPEAHDKRAESKCDGHLCLRYTQCPSIPDVADHVVRSETAGDNQSINDPQSLSSG